MWPLKDMEVQISLHCSLVCIRQYLVKRFREGNGTPLQYSCLENPMDGGTWWAAVHGVAKSRTRLSDFPFTFHFHALEKEMATHSSVLAWRIPGTGEPGGLPSMGLHRVRHYWSDLAAAAAVNRFLVNMWQKTMEEQCSLFQSDAQTDVTIIKLRWCGESWLYSA